MTQQITTTEYANFVETENHDESLGLLSFNSYLNFFPCFYRGKMSVEVENSDYNELLHILVKIRSYFVGFTTQPVFMYKNEAITCNGNTITGNNKTEVVTNLLRYCSELNRCVLYTFNLDLCEDDGKYYRFTLRYAQL
jgi:hypothetical protein